jgi:pimeloyl-ACP methyl ester carboxylesterase
MKDAIAGAEFISLPGHGHNIHWEDPEKVGQLDTAISRTIINPCVIAARSTVPGYACFL